MKHVITHNTGFRWGAADFSRLFEDNGQVTTSINTPYCKLLVRVTATGLVRIEVLRGRKGAVKFEDKTGCKETSCHFMSVK